jgi:hypothetical protein
MNKFTWLETIIPVVVPAAIALFKQLLPQIPKPWLPVLAPVLGAVIEVAATRQVGAGTAAGAALGAAGVGLREIVDQLRKAASLQGDGAAPGSSPPARKNAGFAPLLLLLALPLFAFGCKTADETAFKTIASLEAAVDHAMNAWADYVVLKRAANPPDPALPGQERQVRAAYTSYRLAMSAAYAARAAYVIDEKAGLPAWQARLDAASAAAHELLALVDTSLGGKLSVTEKP